MLHYLFDGVKPPIDFRLPEDTTCPALLRSKMNYIFSDNENKKVSKTEFRAPWIDTNGKVIYNHIELKTGEDLNGMW